MARRAFPLRNGWVAAVALLAFPRADAQPLPDPPQTTAPAVPEPAAPQPGTRPEAEGAPTASAPAPATATPPAPASVPTVTAPATAAEHQADVPSPTRVCIGGGVTVMGATKTGAVGPAIELLAGVNRSNSELAGVLSFVPGRAPGFGLGLRWLGGPNLGPVRLLFGLEGGAVLLVPGLADTVASGAGTTAAFDLTGHLLAASFRLGPALVTVRALSAGVYVPLPRGNLITPAFILGGGVTAAYVPGGSP